jgi:hypothetical protein
MTVHTGPRLSTSEPDLSPSGSDPPLGVLLGTRSGIPVVTLAGSVDHELIEQADPMLQFLTLERDGPILIDVSGVYEVNGDELATLVESR